MDSNYFFNQYQHLTVHDLLRKIHTRCLRSVREADTVRKSEFGACADRLHSIFRTNFSHCDKNPACFALFNLLSTSKSDIFEAEISFSRIFASLRLEFFTARCTLSECTTLNLEYIKSGCTAP